jgi:hypothetical protein
MKTETLISIKEEEPSLKEKIVINKALNSGICNDKEVEEIKKILNI